MRKTKPNLPLMLLAGVLMIAASAPVAMRVEVQPQRADGAGTLVVMVIQVSPEDRTRIGSNAMVRIEIDGRAAPGQSALWAVSLENDGSAEIETTWPIGEHDLRVEIANPSGKDTGLWVGKVRVPEFGGSDDVSTTTVRPTPEPEPAPEYDSGRAAGVAGVATTPPVAEASTASPPPEKPAASTVVAADEQARAPEPGAIDAPQVTPVAARPETRSSPEGPTPEDTGVATETAANEPEAEAPAPTSEIAPTTEDPVSTEPEVAAVAAAGAAPAVSTVTPSPTVEESEIVTEATALSEQAPVVEPVRSREPPPAGEPMRGEPAKPTSAAPDALPVQPSAAILDAYQEWGNADPKTTDLTVVVMRNRQSVSNLKPDDLELRVGGSPVPITDIGDAEHAPLLLGVAVDLAQENVGRWGQVSKDLRPLAERAGGGLGSLFVATTGTESLWNVDPERLDEAIATPAGGDVAALIRSSLGKFANRRGRTFLLVLTDGRTEPSKDAWRETTAALESAGVPVLVMALWDDGFKRKLRKNLQQIGSISGGRLFMLQSFDQLEGAVERYGAVLDAGVALRFESPAAGNGGAKVAVTAQDRTLDITAPKAIR